MKKCVLGLLVSVLVTTGLTACSTSPAVTFYTLDNGQRVVVGQGSKPSVIITQTSLSDLLDRPQIVTRAEGNQVQLSEQHRWAEPLRRGIPRVLAVQLSSLLNSSQVAVAPAPFSDADFRLQIDIQRFEFVAGQGVDVDILWRLEGLQSGVSGRSRLTEAVTSSDVAAQVAAQQRALARVAGEIAGEIKRQPQSTK